MGEETQNSKQQQGAVPEVDAETLARCENALMELSRSLKAVNFYPRGHPTLITTLEKTQNTLVQALAGIKELWFVVSRDGFTYQSRPVGPNNLNIPPLARELFLRQVKKIFFLPEVTIQEIENFLRVIAMEEDLFRGEGKAEDYLSDNGVEHIWFNEIRFGQARGLPIKERQPQEVKVDLDDRLKRLLQALRGEKDARKFLAYSREAAVTALRFIDEQKFDAAFEILKAFWECFSADPPRPPIIAEAARTSLLELMTAPMMEYVLRQLTLLHGPRQEEMLEISKVFDYRLIEAILDKLSTNEALYSHRALIQVLLQMRDISRESVEGRLKDNRWHVVRKMAFLLGEMGNSRSVASLISVAGHSDARVAKEALKSLSKIKTVESTRCLISLLNPKTPAEIHAHVIRLLAHTKEISAVPTLVKFLKGRTVLLENIELYQEAVRALGMIGSQQAVPILERILSKRSLLAKSRSLALSLEAAEALRNIGGKAALEVLTNCSKNKIPEVSAACRKALQAIEKPQGEPTPETTSAAPVSLADPHDKAGTEE